MKTLIISKELPLCVTSSSDQYTALKDHLLDPIINQSQRNKASSVRAFLKPTQTTTLQFNKPDHLCFKYNDIHVGIPSMLTSNDSIKRHKDNYHAIVYETKETYSERMQNCFENRIWNDIYVKYKDEPCFGQYMELNKIFCEEIIKLARVGDCIVIVDHALWMLPIMLKSRINVKVGVSVTEPFPNVEVFRTLPNPIEILTALLSADYIEFQDEAYLNNFVMTCEILLNATQRTKPYRMVDFNAKETKLGVNRITSDCNTVRNIVKSERCQTKIAELKEIYKNKTIIVCVAAANDNITFTNALMALEAYLHRYGNGIALLLLELPEGIRDQETNNENKRMLEYLQITYNKVTVDHYYPIQEHVYFALLSIANIGLFINERCAVNKPAMDYLISTEGNGNLITSMFASFNNNFDLLTVNPKDSVQTAETIRKCIEGYKQNICPYLKSVENQNPQAYIASFVNSMCDQALQLKTNKDLTLLKQKFQQAEKKIFCLDYDGTLISLMSNPDDAKPDDNLVELLNNLSENYRICVVTGRDKQTMNKWIENAKIEISAEHGQFYRKDGHWIQSDADLRWKESAKQIINFFVERTPESFMEEKESALCFHYRKADAKISVVQSKALKSALTKIFRKCDVDITEGKFIVEIRANNVDKGHVVSKLANECDFMLVAGDDTTDEDMFNESLLDEKMFSIVVGYKRSKAKFMLENVKAMRQLLNELCKI